MPLNFKEINMYILEESNRRYHQTIKIGLEKNEVIIIIDGKEKFNGEALNIINIGNKLSFNDKNGKKYEFTKCSYFTKC